MTPNIILKLSEQIESGIDTEPKVVYIMAGIRKLIERNEVQEKYPNLKFHCDWTLHSQLEGTGARRVLIEFDQVQALLKSGKELHQLPREMRSGIEAIGKLALFEVELTSFLWEYGLPVFTRHGNQWSRFVYLYARVIEDIPLTFAMKTSQARPGDTKRKDPKNITKIIVGCDLAQETLKFGDKEDVLYRLRWEIYDLDGSIGEIDVFQTFEKPKL